MKGRMYVSKLEATHVAVVNTPPPPIPPISNESRNQFEDIKKLRWERLTKRAAISISMLVDSPHIKVPTPANSTAVCWALLRPMTLHKRPYNGVKVAVAKRYLFSDLVPETHKRGNRK
jgi:hypothetical protein